MKKIALLLSLCCLLLAGCQNSQGDPTGMPGQNEATEALTAQATLPAQTQPEQAPSGEAAEDTLLPEEEALPEETPEEIPEETPEGSDAFVPALSPDTDSEATMPPAESESPAAPAQPTPSTPEVSQPTPETQSPTQPDPETPTAPESGTPGTDVPPSYIPPDIPKESDNEILMFRCDTITIPLGSSKQAEVFYFGNGTLRWYALQPALIQISESGVITPLWDGNFIIYVTDGTYTDSIYVKVPEENQDAEPSLYFKNSNIQLEAGETLRLEVFGSAVTHYHTVTYTTSERHIASIYRKELTAHNPGTTIVTAECAGHRTMMIVTVVPATPKPPELILRYSKMYFHLGYEYHMGVCYTGDGELKWVSLDPDIIKVLDSGYIAGLSEGVGRFYVTDGTVTTYCEITVLPKGTPFPESNVANF